MYDGYTYEVIAPRDGKYPTDHPYPPVPPEAVGGIQVTSALGGDNVQPDPIVTVKLAVPAAAATLAELVGSEYVHVVLAPACVTVNVALPVLPVTVIWPVREVVPVLAPTV